MLCLHTVLGASWLLHTLDDVDVIGWSHAPKTSGSTTYKDTLLQLEDKGTATYPTLTRYTFQGSTQSYLVGENFASGCKDRHWHCTPSEMEECLRLEHPSAQRVGWMTVVRDPVQRVLSEYYYYRAKCE